MIYIPPSVDLKPLLEGASRDFIHAMMTNPTIEPELLAGLLANTVNLEPEAWWNVCASGIMNPRLKHTIKADTFDEQVQAWDHEKPIGAVWDLFLTAPATPKWASALSNVGSIPFLLVLPDRFYPDMKTEEGREDWGQTHGRRNAAYRELFMKAVQEKWVGPEGVGNEGRLGNFVWVRRGFAEAYVRSIFGHDERIKFATHADPAFRIGYYLAADVRPEWPIEDYIERDGMEFVEAVAMNDSLYLRMNCDIQRRLKAVVREQTKNFDHVITSMKRWRERMVAKDPELYGDTPTEEMLEHCRRADELAARRERMAAPMEAAKPVKKGWFR
ncbi:hypothetical protein [Bosea sp. BIWAKO-01]|uniref:hypothetical protein n=1 Tax=Bosea sp. BIWAKO-01 TaxID=506668 RepID=UPI00114C9452|nr:hypothetical protein [Bosea sp. BIWAKO-01]